MINAEMVAAIERATQRCVARRSGDSLAESASHWDALSTAAQAMEMDHSLEIVEEVGPIIRKQELQRVREALLDALQRWTVSRDLPDGIEPDSLGGLVKYVDLLDTLERD